MTPDQGISVHDADDRMLFATDRDGFTAVVIVDGSQDVDHQDVIEAFDDVGKELAHTAYVGSHLLGNRRARESRRDEREETISTDGGSDIDAAGIYRGAGDGQCLAIKKADGERCTNGVYKTRLRCGHHLRFSDDRLAHRNSERDFYWCSGCGFQPADYGGGGEPFCSRCGIQFPLTPDDRLVTPEDEFTISLVGSPEIKDTESDDLDESEIATDGGTDIDDAGRERGLYDKYEVLKDGEPIDGEAFILRPDRDHAARMAIIAYAEATDNEELADDLLEWVGEIRRSLSTESDDEPEVRTDGGTAGRERSIRSKCGSTDIEHSHERHWMCRDCFRFYDADQLDRLAERSLQTESEDELATDGGEDPFYQKRRVRLVEAYPELPDELEVLVGDEGFVVNPGGKFNLGGKVLVQFDENKTGRPGGERHWIQTDYLEPLGEHDPPEDQPDVLVARQPDEDLRTDGGKPLPWDEDDKIVRRTRLEPGRGDDDEDEGPDLATDGGTVDEDPVMRYIGVSEELDELADEVDADGPPESVIASTSRQLSQLVLDMAHELEEQGDDDSDDHRIGDDRILTDGGWPAPDRDLDRALEDLPDDPEDLVELANDDVRVNRYGDVVSVHPYREAPNEPVTDGGQSLPVGVGTPGEVEVESWAADFQPGDPITFEAGGRVVEEPVLGFSKWEQYRGLPVVRPPDGLVVDGVSSPDLIVVREQDLVEEQPELATDGGRDVDDDGSERLQYLTNGELRAEIVYAAGGDPTRYGVGSPHCLVKDEVKRVACQLEPEDSDVDIEALDLEGLYRVVCRWAGGEHQPNAGNVWGINRNNLKKIHGAVGGRPPDENPLIAGPDGGSSPETKDEPEIRTDGGQPVPERDGSTYGLHREDVPEAVARVFDRLDGPIEVTARPEGGQGSQYELDWHRIDVPEPPETDGGFTTARELASDADTDDVTEASFDPSSSLYLNPISDRVLTGLFIAAIVVHFPLDIGITALAWHLESNPVVLELGVWRWVGLKLVTLVLATFVYLDSRSESPDPYPLSAIAEWLDESNGASYPVVGAGLLGILTGMGIGLIWPNVVMVLAGVIG